MSTDTPCKFLGKEDLFPGESPQMCNVSKKPSQALQRSSVQGCASFCHSRATGSAEPEPQQGGTEQIRGWKPGHSLNRKQTKAMMWHQSRDGDYERDT